MMKDTGDGGRRAKEQRRQHDLGYQPKGQVDPGRAKSAFQPYAEPSDPAEPASTAEDT